MGRPRKSTADHERDGTLRYDRHAARMREPKFGGAPKRPRHLKGEAKKFWDFVVPRLVEKGVATEIDAPALEMMAVAWAEYRNAVDVKLEPWIVFVEDEFGGMEPQERHPTLKDLRQRQMVICGWQRAWTEIAAKFGLTPTDRAKLEIDLGEDQGNPFEQFLKAAMQPTNN